MSLLDTSHIPCWPSSVFLAHAKITHHPDTDFLSEPELNDLKELSTAKRRNEFVSGRKLVREAITEKTGDASLLSVYKQELGKPTGVLGDREFFLSFSHTNDHVFCAFSMEKDIGIDVELLTRKVHNGLMSRILNENEQDLLEVFSPIQVWTIKEAAVKRKGIGIRLDLKKIEVLQNHHLRFDDDSNFRFCNFKTPEYSISLVY